MSDANLHLGTKDDDGSRDAIARGRLRRVSSLALLTTRTLGEGFAAALQGSPDMLGFHERTAERYAELLGHSKGVLMKAGQMLSFLTLAPLGSPETQTLYRTALMRLNGDAPPMPPQLARTVLERELGSPVEHVFSDFDWTPLAAASIGQVHAGKLQDGRAVAVKIQYPGAADAIRSDLKNIELLATFLSLTFKAFPELSFDLKGMSREFGLRITEELDYRRERRHQAEFAAHYRGHPFIRVPEVIDELCTERVLTQELAVGCGWSEALESSQELRDLWGEAIYRFTYGSFSRLALVQADPHPGNFIFHEDGGVSFLDFGCVKRFSREQVDMCQESFRAAYLDNDALGTWRAGVEAELWGASDLSPEETLLLWRGWRGYLCEEQPLTLTPAHVARSVEHCSLAGGEVTIRRHTGSSEYAVMPRIEMGVLSLLAELRATNDWRAIASSEWLNEGSVR